MTSFHDFNPMMPWAVANWRERIGICIFYFIVWGVLFPAMIVGALLIIGYVIDGVEQRGSQLRSCQKHAVTPYEYHECR